MAENETMVIIDHYKSLDDDGKIAFRDQVLARTGMGYATFYNKMRGESRITKAEIYVINLIIAEGNGAER